MVEACGSRLGEAVRGQRFEGEAAGLLVSGGPGLVLPPRQVARLCVWFGVERCRGLIGSWSGEAAAVRKRRHTRYVNCSSAGVLRAATFVPLSGEFYLDRVFVFQHSVTFSLSLSRCQSLTVSHVP